MGALKRSLRTNEIVSATDGTGRLAKGKESRRWNLRDLFVHVFSVGDVNNNNARGGIVDAIDDAVIADAKAEVARKTPSQWLDIVVMSRIPRKGGKTAIQFLLKRAVRPFEVIAGELGQQNLIHS